MPQIPPGKAEVAAGAASTTPEGAGAPELLYKQYGRMALAACACGFAATLLGRSTSAPQWRRRRFGMRGVGGRRVASIDRPLPVPLERGDLEHVEDSIEKFVPKISALQSQAELLRSTELKEVLTTMTALRKTELRGVFSEVDQLLCALVDAIDGLRESATTIHKRELKEHFERFEQGLSSQPDTMSALPAPYAKTQGEVDTMMEVHVVGLSHHNAPVEVREKLAVPEAQWNQYAQDIVEFASTPSGCVVPEVAVLSTCNRFELYFASSEVKSLSATECVHAFLRKRAGLTREELEPYLFTHSGEEATQHLFEVSSGLDSLVLGEAQILAQVKACHEHSIEKPLPEDQESKVPGAGGKIIAKMLNAGIRMGKLVRTRTKIGKGSVSVSSAAVELMISKALPDLRKYPNNLRVCILGAGKMARLLLIALFSKNPDTYVTVVNRSTDKAQAVLDEDLVKARGGKNAKVAPLDRKLDVVSDSDVVFAATASAEPILNASELTGRQRSVMLIDISVPRNIAPDCGAVEKVTSYSVDDLKKVVQANAEKRQSEVLKAKRLIVDEVAKFKMWQASQGAVPYLAALQSMAEEIRRSETEKLSLKLSGLHEKEQEAVDKLTRHIIDQLFRPIYYSMKESEEIAEKRSKIWALKSIFKLEPEYKRRLLPGGATPAQLNP